MSLSNSHLNVPENFTFSIKMRTNESFLYLICKYYNPKRVLLHLWTFKTPIFTELKKSKNVKSIMMVLLFPLLFWLLKR